MGYTHYWSFGPYITEKNYKQALTECRKVIRNSPIPVGNWEGKGGPRLRNGFSFNGIGGCETFSMGATPDRGNWLCKTNQYPYDEVVTACLCILQDRLGDAIHVSSDGDPTDWEAGKELACAITGRDIKIPQAVRDQIKMYGWYAKKYREEHPEYEYTSLDITHPNHKDEHVPDWAKE